MLLFGVTVMLEVRNLCKTWRSRAATSVLDDFTLNLLAGRRYSILGPSGSGKSTLLRTICGLDSADAGEVVFGGHSDWQTKGRCVYLPQRPPLIPWKTVRDHLTWALSLCGCPIVEVDYRTEAIIELLGLGPHLSKRPSELSGGWRHITAFAMARAIAPTVLLMDEPFSGVDIPTRDAIWDLVSAEVDTGRIEVLVTHDPAEACRISDEIIVCSGPPLRVVASVLVDENHRYEHDLSEQLRDLTRAYLAV